MQALKLGAALGAGAIALTACVTAPSGPTVRVMPAPGKPFEVFMADDQLCRGYAAQSIAGSDQASADHAVGTAVAATAIGAAAGALMGGNGRSAGTGAGIGLVAGSAIGAGQGDHSSYGLQRRYDISYEQCMYSKGNLLPGQALPYNNQRLPPAPPPPPPQ